MEWGVVAYYHIFSVDESVGHKVEHRECADGDHIKNYVEVREECNGSSTDTYIMIRRE